MLCTPLFCEGTARAADLFGYSEQPAEPEHQYYKRFNPQWQRVLRQEKALPAFTGSGENFGDLDAQTWRNLVDYVKGKPDTDVLRLVNGYFNYWPGKSDEQLWGQKEYWESPIEFIKVRGADCEGYAIAKYFALRFFGFKAKDMRITVVLRRDAKGRNLPELHAVLAVYANETWFILDNNARPRDSITPHAQYQDRFKPLYAVNETSAWVYRDKTNSAGTSR